LSSGIDLINTRVSLTTFAWKEYIKICVIPKQVTAPYDTPASCSHVHGNNTCTCIKSTKPEGYLIDQQVMHLGYIFITSGKERSNKKV
jgi:hypothetical protein